MHSGSLTPSPGAGSRWTHASATWNGCPFLQLLWVISQPEKLFTQEEDHMAHVNALQRSIAAAASFWRERQVPFDCVLNLFE